MFISSTKISAHLVWVTVVGTGLVFTAGIAQAQRRDRWQDPGSRRATPPDDRWADDDRPAEGPNDRVGRPNNRPGGRFGAQGQPGEPPPWRELPERRRKQVVRFIEEHFPSLWVELQDLREHRPDQFRRRIRRLFPDFSRLMEVMHKDPQKGALLIRERQLHLRIRHLADKFHEEKEPNIRKRVRKEMRKLCGEAFGCQLERRAIEVRALEARLGELKGRLAEQQLMRDEIISRRMRKLLEQKHPRPGASRRSRPD